MTQKTSLRPSLPVAALALAAALGLAACGDKAEAPAPAPAAAPAPNAAPAPAPAPAAAADPSEKLQAYIDCYNRLDGRAHRALTRYASWIKDMEAGPTGNERIVYGLYTIDTEGVAGCKTAMTEAAAQKPVLDKLDPAAVAYIQSLETLDKTVNEADRYYSRENYKDDKFAKGKELHPPLLAQAKAFRAASDVFSRELEVENDKLLAAQIAEVERAEGRKLTYWRMSLMAQAKQLVNLMAEDDFELEGATARLAAYEKTTDEAMAYGAAHKAELPTAWFTIEQSAEEYRKAAKQRLRRVRDKVPYTEGEKMMLKPGSGWMVDGSQEQFTKAYNSLVESSNSLN